VSLKPIKAHFVFSGVAPYRCTARTHPATWSMLLVHTYPPAWQGAWSWSLAVGSMRAIPAVRFTEEAQEVFDGWRDELEGRLRTAELSPALESHLAKYRSLMPSLALIFQLIEFVDGTAEGGAIGLRPAVQAAAWCEYLETHARRLYSSAENPAMEGARALLDRIRKGDVSDGDSTRSVYRKHWTKLSTPEEVSSACNVLEEFGWLRLEVTKTSGRSTTGLRLHPTLREQA
jgi:Protein of unknown function (DUF3987)